LDVSEPPLRRVTLRHVATGSELSHATGVEHERTKVQRPTSSLSMTVRTKHIAIISATFTALMCAWAGFMLRDPMPHFMARRSSLVAADTGSAATDSTGVFTPVHIKATSGLEVDLMVRRPLGASNDARLPLVVILGGHLNGREAVHLVGSTPGVAVAALSYPFNGDPRPSAATFLREIPQIREAFLDTPPAIMLALDYLVKLPFVDSSRVDMVGVSLGAPFATIAGALDDRFRRVWSLHGSGGSYRPLEANMGRTIHFAPLRVVAAFLANIIIDGPRLDPVHWAPLIAPRPFIMVNAASDERLPRASIEDLYRSAHEPKELMWMNGKHIHGDSATIRRLVDVVMARVVSKI
jgi:dienelactone hydrolase